MENEGPPPEKLVVALELVAPGKEFQIPPEYLKINSLDDDSMRWHLEHHVAQQVHVAKLYADCEFYLHYYEQAANKRSAEVWLNHKLKPAQRWMAKQQGYVQMDASDELCTMVAKADYLVNNYRLTALAWRRHRDYLRGAMAAFDAKSAMLASLSGLRRTELEAINSTRRSQN